MAYEPVFNPTDTPVVIDAEGRVLGGGEWGGADTDQESVQAALDRGALVKSDEPTSEQRKTVDALNKDKMKRAPRKAQQEDE